MNRTVAVIGAGLMGRGISICYALKDYDVNLYDTSEGWIARTPPILATDLQLLVDEGLVEADRAARALGHIHLVADLQQAVGAADFITEAVPELLQTKWEVIERLEAFAKREAIIASNTSTFPAAELSKHMAVPERLVITHFFNPAQILPLVEIVKSEKTSPAVVERARQLMLELGKEPIVLKKEVPGFIANRLQAAILREALYLVSAGVADAADIDRAITAGPGCRWPFIGPIATADVNGLDTWQQILKNLCPQLDASKTSPDFIDRLVAEGNLGAKTGWGIYEYSGDGGTVESRLARRNLNLVRLLKIKQGE